MGGGDLNLKKSWHPGTLRNQEKVWKKERDADEEKKKLDQLLKEKNEERQLMELQALNEATGKTKKRSERLDWMYSAGPSGNKALVDEDREAYLLGKKRVDRMVEQAKTVEEMDSAAAQFNHANAYGLTANTIRDTQAKIREDPILAIKKREHASLQSVLNNPVELKRLKEAKTGKKEKKHKKDKERKRDRDDRLDLDRSSTPDRKVTRERSVKREREYTRSISPRNLADRERGLTPDRSVKRERGYNRSISQQDRRDSASLRRLHQSTYHNDSPPPPPRPRASPDPHRRRDRYRDDHSFSQKRSRSPSYDRYNNSNNSPPSRRRRHDSPDAAYHHPSRDYRESWNDRSARRSPPRSARPDRRSPSPRSRSPPRPANRRQLDTTISRRQRSRSRSPPASVTINNARDIKKHDLIKPTDTTKEIATTTTTIITVGTAIATATATTTTTSAAEERARKLAEMQQDAKDWDQARTKRVHADRLKEEEENRQDLEARMLRLNDKNGSESFLHDLHRQTYASKGVSAADMITRNRATVQRGGGGFLEK
ncbi:hypothetical protein PhCBS80983_g03404 [Powellomyces hirtus]|uniref:CBF1-interacting co-repressor CIR N-terminal domain-containing protein n=1 Tax=Powellomyces hirtus TaxID=109895 RepID=A0A507E2T1_9FUNG|nr:hypothetical protein PhCBS80983_g03404 [Powellomyces hirtus]